ncbi:unnamed protein product, partial [Pocillopora meandrina]
MLERSFIAALDGRVGIFNRCILGNTSIFSCTYKEWKFCQYELHLFTGLTWMHCPSCSISKHSCHVDGNMKLYHYKSSGLY